MLKNLGSNKVKIHGNTNFDTPNWKLMFHLHTNASLLAVCVLLVQNATSKYDQPIVYAFRLLNKTKHNYTTIDREALIMVYVLHKFKYFCWEINLFFM